MPLNHESYVNSYMGLLLSFPQIFRIANRVIHVLVWRIVLNAFIPQAFIQLDSITHSLASHKHGPSISMFVGEVFKFTYHECCNMMATE